MKVLLRDKMPDGTDIQIEDWTKDNNIRNTLTIGAYPIAKNTGKYKWIKAGDRFRLSIDRGFTTDEEVKKAFNDLKEGKKKLEDFSEYFWNLEKDQWYLGMTVEYNQDW